MTDLVIGVRLKADGSGLSAALRQTRGDIAGLGDAATQASAGTKKLADASAAAGAAADRYTASAGKARQSTEALATEKLKLFAAEERLEAALGRLAVAQQEAAKAADTDADAQRRAGIAVAQAQANAASAQAALNRLTGASNDNVKAFGRQGNAVRMAGQQVGDFFMEVQAGIDPSVAFSQQIGQLGYAMSEMGGKAGKVGAFLVGPWGIALTIGAALLAPFIEKLLSASTALEDYARKLEDAAKLAGAQGGLSDAQTALGQMFDLTTGKIKGQSSAIDGLNDLIRLNIQLTGLRLKAEAAAEQASSDKTFASVGSRSLLGNTFGRLEYPVSAIVDAQQRQQRQILDDLRSGKIDQAGAINRANALSDNGLAVSRTDFIQAIVDAASAKVKNEIGDLTLKSGSSGVLDPALRQTKNAPKPKSTASVDEFGRDAADRIAALTEQFNGTPKLIDEIDGKFRQLDDLIDDLGRKKPPNFEVLIDQAQKAKTVIGSGLINAVAQAFNKPKTLGEQAAAAIGELDAEIERLNSNPPKGVDAKKLIADAQAAKQAIVDGLQRPYDEFLKSQNDQLRVGELILAGRQAEADALRVEIGWQQKGLTLSRDQHKELVASFVELEKQSKALEAVQRRQQNLLNLTGNVRGNLVDALSGRSGDLAGAILDSFRQAFAEQIAQRFIDPILNRINDQITGASAEEQAAAQFSAAIGTTIAPLQQLDAAAGNAANALNALSVPGGSSGIDAGAPVTSLAGQPDEITVTGKLLHPAQGITGVAGVAQALVGGFGDLLKSIFGRPIEADLTSKSVKSLGKGFDQAVSGISGVLGKAAEGAGTGLAISGLANSLGIKLDNSGSAIGGTIGSIAGSFIPGVGTVVGSIAGSLLGGIFGGLFAPAASAKSGAITDTTSQVKVTGTKQDQVDTITGLVSQVQGFLGQAASALGAEVGSFDVSISKRERQLAVDTTGQGRQTGAGVANFQDTNEAGAVAYAIADAIADGAIQGIDAKVKQALTSTSDLNKALKDALGVQDVEKLLGGVNAAIKQTFDSFDKTAADRVDIAKRYGFDLLQVEKANAEQRAQLVDDTLKQRIGSLQDFLNSVKYGDLYEGSATDRRNAILGDIAKAQADVQAGKDGAADQLAQLYDQLLQTTKDAFGTAGPEYAADRNSAIANVEQIIKAETDRVNEAAGIQADQLDQLKSIATQTDESNDQLAQLNTGIDRLNATLTNLFAPSGATDLSGYVQRTSKVAG